MSLNGKMVLITGAAKRIGRSLSLAVAQTGADVVIHYGNSRSEAESARMEIESLGRKAFLLQADLADAEQVANLISRAQEHGPVFALINNAANTICNTLCVPALTFLGANAGELLTPVVYAMPFGLTAKMMAEAMLPYPTMTEAVRWAASQF